MLTLEEYTQSVSYFLLLMSISKLKNFVQYFFVNEIFHKQMEIWYIWKLDEMKELLFLEKYSKNLM